MTAKSITGDFPQTLGIFCNDFINKKKPLETFISEAAKFYDVLTGQQYSKQISKLSMEYQGRAVGFVLTLSRLFNHNGDAEKIVKIVHEVGYNNVEIVLPKKTPKYWIRKNCLSFCPGAKVRCLSALETHCSDFQKRRADNIFLSSDDEDEDEESDGEESGAPGKELLWTSLWLVEKIKFDLKMAIQLLESGEAAFFKTDVSSKEDEEKLWWTDMKTIAENCKKFQESIFKANDGKNFDFFPFIPCPVRDEKFFSNPAITIEQKLKYEVLFVREVNLRYNLLKQLVPTKKEMADVKVSVCVLKKIQLDNEKVNITFVEEKLLEIFARTLFGLAKREKLQAFIADPNFKKEKAFLEYLLLGIPSLQRFLTPEEFAEKIVPSLEERLIEIATEMENKEKEIYKFL